MYLLYTRYTHGNKHIHHLQQILCPFSCACVQDAKSSHHETCPSLHKFLTAQHRIILLARRSPTHL